MIAFVLGVIAARDVLGVEVERPRVDVGEDRRRAAPRDRLGGRVERERGADHLVARADLHRVEHEHERVGAVRDADRVLGTPRYAAASSSNAVDVRAEDEPARLEHVAEALLQLVEERRVLRLDVNERDRRHGGPV